MCFSAPASFTASILLTVVGIETFRKVHNKNQLVFASIPLFFAFQQAIEGVLWLTIPHKDLAWLQTLATYIFLLMAQIIWPVMVPFSVLWMEKIKNRKKILTGLLICGALVSLYYLYSLAFYRPWAEISTLHIAYQSTFADPLSKLTIIIYLAATLIPLFVSSIKRTYILGIIIGLSFLVTTIFYIKCLTSVWCFFAAVISFVIYYIIRDAHKKFHFDLKALKALAHLPPK